MANIGSVGPMNGQLVGLVIAVGLLVLLAVALGPNYHRRQVRRRTVAEVRAAVGEWLRPPAPPVAPEQAHHLRRAS